MYERGDFGTDHDIVEGVFQSFERLRCRHPTNLQIKTAAEKIHGFLDPEHLNEAFARPFPFPQTIPTDPCTALVAASAYIPFDIPGWDERQQLESGVVTGNLSSQQNGVVTSKQNVRRRPPLILGSYAMVHDVAVLPALAVDAIPRYSWTPGPAGADAQNLFPAPSRPTSTPLSLPSLTSSTLTLPDEINEQTTNIMNPWKYNDPSVDNSRAVLHKSPALVDSLAPTTGMNQESMDVTAMSGMEFPAYYPPLNLCYFMQRRIMPMAVSLRAQRTASFLTRNLCISNQVRFSSLRRHDTLWLSMLPLEAPSYQTVRTWKWERGAGFGPCRTNCAGPLGWCKTLTRRGQNHLAS